MKNANSSDGRKISGRVGPLRSPMSGFHPFTVGTMNPSTAANTTTPGIAKASAPIRSPQNGGAIVKYGGKK